MKNQYFGDVNDYLKYGLLRCFANAGLTTGVCWMLTPDDARTDGRKITYLNDPNKWRTYDSPLFDLLLETVKNQKQHVRQAQRAGFLERTVFFTQVVPDDEGERKKWLARAFKKLTSADLLFFDPDNGIEIRSKPKGSRDSNKYLFWDEIEAAWLSGKSLLVFQHFPRANHQAFTAKTADECRERLRSATVVPLITANVLFLLACQPNHETKINLALEAVGTAWAGRIELSMRANRI